MPDRQATLFEEFIQRGVRAQKAVDKILEPPLSHTNDPQTSYDAADKLIKSGALNRQENEVLGAARHYYNRLGRIDFTARELANWTEQSPIHNHLTYHLIQRRLSGLHNKSKIERTGEKRNGCMVWRIK